METAHRTTVRSALSRNTRHCIGRLGTTQQLILKAIDCLELAYGLSIFKHLNEILGASNPLDEASIYVNLDRLKRRGLIVVKEIRSARSSPPLKIYKLTPAGKRALKMSIERTVTILKALQMND